MELDRVRHFVDGELSAEMHAEVTRALEADESLRAMVEFERALRGSIAQHLIESAPQAPAGVREAIETALAGGGVSAGSAGVHDPGALARFFAPTRANVLAVAACLLIVAGAVIVGIFGDEWGLGLRQPANHQAPGDPNLNLATISVSAEQAGAEHWRMMGQGDALLTSLTNRDAALIQANLSTRLGIPVPVFDLSRQGLTLVGGQATSLNPLPDATVQLVYIEGAPEKGTPARGLSIFMQPDQGQFGTLENVMTTGRVYTPTDFQSCGGEPISIFSDGRVVYVIRGSYPAVQQIAQAEVLRVLARGASASSQ